MSKKRCEMAFSEELEVTPRLGYLCTRDSLDIVQSSGYINPYIKMNSMEIYPTDIVLISASNGVNACKPVFNEEEITLVDLF